MLHRYAFYQEQNVFWEVLECNHVIRKIVLMQDGHVSVLYMGTLYSGIISNGLERIYVCIYVRPLFTCLHVYIVFGEVVECIQQIRMVILLCMEPVSVANMGTLYLGKL